MTKAELERAFFHLGEMLRARKVTGEIAVFGGAAIVLGFDFRRATQDVDSMITQGHGAIVRAQEEVRRELDLPSNWLNEQATVYLSNQRNDFGLFKTYPSEGQFGLRVLLASPEYLLAMKVLALRANEKDVQDIILLTARLRLEVSTAQPILDIVRHYYPGEQISVEKELAIEDVLRRVRASQKPS